MADEPQQPKRKRGRPPKPKARHLEDYAALKAPPDDPLEAVEWAGKALAVAMHKIVTDPDLDERSRRQELRATAKVLQGLVPTNRLLDAERAVRKAAEAMAQPTADPGLKDVTTKPARSLRINPKR